MAAPNLSAEQLTRRDFGCVIASGIISGLIQVFRKDFENWFVGKVRSFFDPPPKTERGGIDPGRATSLSTLQQINGETDVLERAEIRFAVFGVFAISVGPWHSIDDDAVKPMGWGGDSSLPTASGNAGDSHGRALSGILFYSPQRSSPV